MPSASPAAPVREGRLIGSGLRPAPSAPSAPRAAAPPRRARRPNAIPPSLLNDPELLSDIATLPSNYNFELPKTVHRLRQARAQRVALQMPEGLLHFATTISDILCRHAGVVDSIVLADVTYGACCVDDLSAKALGCDFLVHYGHSCLVPVTQCVLPMLYVFVHIAFEPAHLLACVRENFAVEESVALLGTIQFVDTLHAVRETLAAEYPRLLVPQKRPLSPGELLGCTAPTLPADVDALLYVGDGRFHLESVMIANPRVRAFRYDPYEKKLTEERYAHAEMRAMRHAAVEAAKGAQNFAIVLGTLGRQGSPKILERLRAAARGAGKTAVVVLLSEITPAKVKRFEEGGVHAWVQIACPRLSIDWGEGYGKKPLLNPYEAFVALGKTEWREQYPMDFYAKDGGEWTNYYKEPSKNKVVNKPIAKATA